MITDTKAFEFNSVGEKFELEVLKGVQALLRNTEFVLIETSLISLNHGCPLRS